MSKKRLYFQNENITITLNIVIHGQIIIIRR